MKNTLQTNQKWDFKVEILKIFKPKKSMTSKKHITSTSL